MYPLICTIYEKLIPDIRSKQNWINANYKSRVYRIRENLAKKNP